MTMNTGVFHPDSNRFPGVFIRGEDALKWARCLDLVSIEMTTQGEDTAKCGLNAAAEILELRRVLTECELT